MFATVDSVLRFLLELLRLSIALCLAPSNRILCSPWFKQIAAYFLIVEHSRGQGVAGNGSAAQ